MSVQLLPWEQAPKDCTVVLVFIKNMRQISVSAVRWGVYSDESPEREGWFDADYREELILHSDDKIMGYLEPPKDLVWCIGEALEESISEGINSMKAQGHLT